MDKYQCGVCGHIYDPVIGEPTLSIVSGIDFSDITGTFNCPVCGAEKSMFTKV